MGGIIFGINHHYNPLNQFDTSNLKPQTFNLKPQTLIKFQPLLAVFLVIVREHAYECCDLLYGT